MNVSRLGRARRRVARVLLSVLAAASPAAGGQSFHGGLLVADSLILAGSDVGGEAEAGGHLYAFDLATGRPRSRVLGFSSVTTTAAAAPRQFPCGGG